MFWPSVSSSLPAPPRNEDTGHLLSLARYVVLPCALGVDVPKHNQMLVGQVPGSPAGRLLRIQQQVRLGAWPAFQVWESFSVSAPTKHVTQHPSKRSGLAYGRHLWGIRSPQLTLENRMGRAMPYGLRCRKEMSRSRGTQFVICLQGHEQA